MSLLYYQANGQINVYVLATEIPICLVIGFSWKLRSWSFGVELLGSLLDQLCKPFCSCLCAFSIRNWCRLIHWLFNKDFDERIQRIRDLFLSLRYTNPRSRFSWWWYFYQFRILKLVARTRLLRKFNLQLQWWVRRSWYCSSKSLLPMFLLKIRSVRMLDTIVWSGPLV